MKPSFNPAASVAAFGNWVYPTLKHQADLDRYDAAIKASRPTVLVETGTHNGASAEWFARRVGLVVTIDIKPSPFQGDVRYVARPYTQPSMLGPVDTSDRTGTVFCLTGSSTDPATIQRVKNLTRGHRVMVSLDSDHSRDHVLREIELYAPLVTAGCYLVVEDGIIARLPPDVHEQHGCGIYTGTVSEAIYDADMIELFRDFTHDMPLEGMHNGVTMNPAGWWRRDR